MATKAPIRVELPRPLFVKLVRSTGRVTAAQTKTDLARQRLALDVADAIEQGYSLRAIRAATNLPVATLHRMQKRTAAA